MAVAGNTVLTLRPPVSRAAALFGLAAVLRLALLPSPGNASDVAGLVAFATRVAERGPAPLYDDLSAFGAQYVIPPIFPLLLGAALALWSWLAGAPPPYSAAALLVKLFGLAGDLALGALLYRWVRGAASERWALGATAAFLLSPGLVYDTAWWGQLESLLVLSIAGAFVALAGGRPVPAWLLLGVGMLFKPQAGIALPLLAWLTLRARGAAALARGAVAAAAVTLVITSPYWATGRAGRLLAAYGGALDYYPRVTVNADNLWRLFAGPAGGLEWLPDSTLSPVGPTFRQLGLALFAGYLLLVVSAVRPERPSAWLGAAACLYAGFFMLPTQIHERYLYPAVALLCFSLHQRPWTSVVYGLLAIGLFANLVRVVPWDPRAPAALALIGLDSWGVSLVNTAGFVGISAYVLLGLSARRLAALSVVALATAGVALQTAPPNW